MLASTTVAVGLANYLLTLATVRLLPTHAFSDFAAGQGLLLVLGTGSLAAIPWAVARYLARTSDPEAHHKAMHYGLMTSALQAAVLGPVALFVCWPLGGIGFGITALLAAVMISLLAGPVGFLQGTGDLNAIAGMRAIETALRIVASLTLILLISRSATLALLGFPCGSIASLAYALHRGRRGFPLRRLARTRAFELSHQALSLGAIQVLLAMLGALDTVYADAAHFPASTIASYQAAALLARVPLFVSSAVSTACFTALVAAPDEQAAGHQLRASFRTYAWFMFPFMVLCLTLPRAVLAFAVPAAYTQTLSILKISCASGVIVGGINVLTTAHQARGRFRTATLLLVGGVLLQAAGLVAAGRGGNVYWFAGAELIACTATFACLALDGRIWLQNPAKVGGHRRTAPPMRRSWPQKPAKVGDHRRSVTPMWWKWLLGAVATAVACVDHSPPVWIAMVLITCGIATTLALGRREYAPVIQM